MDEDEVLARWKGEVEDGLLLGPAPGKVEDGSKRLQTRMVDRQANTLPDSDDGHEKLDGSVVEDPRIVVIGDRLFTDTLLAHRLSIHLNSSTRDRTGAEPGVISIHTTSLPERRDVRLLRWFEERLSGGKLKVGRTDWARYTLDPEWRNSTGDERHGQRTEGTSIGESRMTWDPRTWRALAVFAGVGRGMRSTGRLMWRGVGGGIRWAWARARRRGGQLEAEVEGVRKSESRIA